MYDTIKKVINGVEKTIYLSNNPVLRDFQMRPYNESTIKPTDEKSSPKFSKSELRSQIYKLKVAIELLENKKIKSNLDISSLDKYKKILKIKTDSLWAI